MQRYLGVISGTSMDAIDVVTLCVDGDTLSTTSHYSQPYRTEFRNFLEALCHPERETIKGELDAAARADVEMGKLIAEAALQALKEQDLKPEDITAIGSHGQNIRHRPEGEHPFSWQIGNPSFIAELTGITTVADFRMADVAAGGQGAPLAPSFHLAAFASTIESRGILNLGGIANITCVPKSKTESVIGYDTGPANTLMDQWCQRHQNLPFDEDGRWAMSGNVIPELLESMLEDQYFVRCAPKSTGRERFNLNWLESKLSKFRNLAAEDVQRSLLELSARSIAGAINQHQLDSIYTCGGGVENRALIDRLGQLLGTNLAGTTSALGIHPQHVEGAAFAWFAHQTLQGLSSSLPAVTGARRPRILGGIYQP